MNTPPTLSAPTECPSCTGLGRQSEHADEPFKRSEVRDLGKSAWCDGQRFRIDTEVCTLCEGTGEISEDDAAGYLAGLAGDAQDAADFNGQLAIERAA